MDDRVKAMSESLDRVFELAMDRPFSVRVDIGEACTSLMGNNVFDPSTLYFHVLPEIVQSKIVLLKMLSKGDSIPNVGRRHSANVYYISLTPRQWESFKHEAVSSL